MPCFAGAKRCYITPAAAFSGTPQKPAPSLSKFKVITTNNAKRGPMRGTAAGFNLNYIRILSQEETYAGEYLLPAGKDRRDVWEFEPAQQPEMRTVFLQNKTTKLCSTCAAEFTHCGLFLTSANIGRLQCSSGPADNL